MIALSCELAEFRGWNKELENGMYALAVVSRRAPVVRNGQSARPVFFLEALRLL